MTDTTRSVGLPPSSAATQVPASLFIRSRPALAGGAGGLAPGLPPPWLARGRARRSVSASPHATVRRIISSLLHLGTALARRSGQPPDCPLVERRRAGSTGRRNYFRAPGSAAP